MLLFLQLSMQVVMRASVVCGGVGFEVGFVGLVACMHFCGGVFWFGACFGVLLG
jgi:hypothetical protein